MGDCNISHSVCELSYRFRHPVHGIKRKAAARNASRGSGEGVVLSAASKHMYFLKKAGVVSQGKGRLYEIAPGLLAEDGSRDVRLGRCTLHFGE